MTFAAICGSSETLASDAGCNSITCPSLWRWRTGSSLNWEVTVRVGLISLIAIVGCVATVGAAPRSADDKVPPSADAQKALNETPITRPIVPLDQLIDQIPDGGNCDRTLSKPCALSEMWKRQTRTSKRKSSRLSLSPPTSRVCTPLLSNRAKARKHPKSKRLLTRHGASQLLSSELTANSQSRWPQCGRK